MSQGRCPHCGVIKGSHWPDCPVVMASVGDLIESEVKQDERDDHDVE